MQSHGGHKPCGNATELKQVPDLPGIQKAFARFTFLLVCLPLLGSYSSPSQLQNCELLRLRTPSVDGPQDISA